MTREELARTIAGCDPLAIAADLPPAGAVTYLTGTDPEIALADGDTEGDVETHRNMHLAGRATDATVRYGEGVPADTVAARLLELAALARETGLLRAVCPVPAVGVSTPGSWGVEDLTVVAAARRVLGPDVRVRPSWERLGAQTCAVALAFGADDLVVPPGDTADVVALVASAGRTAVPR